MTSDELRILEADSDIIVVDKPANVYTHPSPGHERGSLSDAVKGLFPEIASVGSPERPGVVHRLDYGTSGVMVFARNRRSYLKLREAFESHERVSKTYLAIVHGAPKQREGALECLIGRKNWDPKRMAIGVEGGKKALTSWRVLARRDGISLVEFKIETGRTHQIRLVANYLGCPIAGDDLYGDKKRDSRMRHPPGRVLLHAAELKFPHPASGKIVSFCAEVPPDIVWAG